MCAFMQVVNYERDIYCALPISLQNVLMYIQNHSFSHLSIIYFIEVKDS